MTEIRKSIRTICNHINTYPDNWRQIKYTLPSHTKYSIKNPDIKDLTLILLSQSYKSQARLEGAVDHGIKDIPLTTKEEHLLREALVNLGLYKKKQEREALNRKENLFLNGVKRQLELGD